MRIGVLTVLYQQFDLEAALDKAVAAGVTAVEIGVGGYPGSQHCRVDDFIASDSEREGFIDAIQSRGLMLSALSVHNNPLHPDEAVAALADNELKKAIRLAAALNVPVVNGFSGLPAGAPGDRMPNWVTCPWPPEFLEMLDYQWNEVAIPYWAGMERYAADHGLGIGFEMHPGMLVYNVESLLRLREATGPALGCNFDPSHLWWNGVDPVAAIRKLDKAIFHVHGKDCYVDQRNIAVNGCNDSKHYTDILNRAWTFRSIGYGHGVEEWKDILSTLRLIGYDYVISIEHEDALMSSDEGLSKAIALLKEANIFEEPGEMFWA